jgi:hypothetical protein
MSDSDAVARMLAGYEPIIRPIICGDLSASDFESDFLSYFKHDWKQVVSEEFEVLDGLFADVDEYVADPRLRGSWRRSRRLRTSIPRAAGIHPSLRRALIFLGSLS